MKYQVCIQVKGRRQKFEGHKDHRDPWYSERHPLHTWTRTFWHVPISLEIIACNELKPWFLVTHKLAHEQEPVCKYVPSWTGRKEFSSTKTPQNWSIKANQPPGGLPCMVQNSSILAYPSAGGFPQLLTTRFLLTSAYVLSEPQTDCCSNHLKSSTIRFVIINRFYFLWIPLLDYYSPQYIGWCNPL